MTLMRAPGHYTKKLSQYWTCTGNQQDTLSSGTQYRFTVPKERRSIAQQNKFWSDIYPAVEPRINDACEGYLGKPTDTLPDDFDALPESDQIRAIWHFLGFGFVADGIDDAATFYQKCQDIDFTLFIPDPTMLQERWQRLREKYPKLHSIQLCSSPGIAEDMAFVKAYLEYDGLVSTGVEFLHDMTAHVIKVIVLVWRAKTDEEYQRQKALYVALIKPGYDLVQEYLDNSAIREKVPLSDCELELLKLSLGLQADSLSAESKLFGTGNSSIEDFQGYSKNLCGRIDSDMSAFLAKKNVTPRDAVNVSVIWDKLKLAMAYKCGLPVISLDSAQKILESAGDRAHIISNGALYVKHNSQVWVFELKTEEPDKGKVAKCRIILDENSTVYLYGEYRDEFPPHVIERVLNAAKKVPAPMGSGAHSIFSRLPRSAEPLDDECLDHEYPDNDVPIIETDDYPCP